MIPETDDLFKVNPELLSEFISGVHSADRVSGFTHGFYKYPARFSPVFVRQAILAFTDYGDLVLDPFMGGGRH